MSLPLQHHIEKDGFRLRGLEVSRIDAFSDVVFGFALTLLVVSLEVPKTYAELYVSLRGFVPFGICFALLMTVWVGHYKYFRRFGTHDWVTIFVNSVLLFVVLFYVYPLKFLFTVANVGLFGATSSTVTDAHDIRVLMLLFDSGFTAIYFLFAMLYWNGLRQRHALELSDLEVLLTRSYIADRLALVGIGLLAGIVAMVLRHGYAGMSGLVFLLIMVVRPVMRRLVRRRLKRFHAGHAAAQIGPVAP